MHPKVEQFSLLDDEDINDEEEYVAAYEEEYWAASETYQPSQICKPSEKHPTARS